MTTLTIGALKEIIKNTKNEELRNKASSELVRRLILIEGVK